MNVQQTTSFSPPKFIQALVSGFNLVASKAYLLLLPIALDLLLWFGPHFRLKTLLTPAIQEMLNNQLQIGGDAAGMATALRQIWEIILGHFNLLSLLSSLPVGIPSLMAAILPNQNPFGLAPAYEITSWSQAVSGWLLFALLGLVLGSLYFGMVARATAQKSETFTLARTVWEVLQIFGMTLLLLVLLFLLSIPAVLFAVLLSMMSPLVAQIAIVVCSFLLLWVLLPLIFTPHGIYVSGQNAIRSMLISGRLVRALFPGVALFLLSAIVMTQGLGYLWRMPPDNSWLLLGGIFGNAFIGTGLLAASFIYYRGAAAWALRQQQESMLAKRIKL